MRRHTRNTATASTTAALATVLLLTGCASGTDAGGSTSEEPMSDQMSEEPMSDEPMADDMSDDMSDDMAGAYDFTAATADGGTFEGAELSGSPAVVWFWGPMCDDCAEQADAVGELAAEHGTDVQVVAVGHGDAGTLADAVPAPADVDDVVHLVDEDGAVAEHLGGAGEGSFTVLDDAGEAVVEGSTSPGEVTAAVEDLVAGTMSEDMSGEG